MKNLFTIVMLVVSFNLLAQNDSMSTRYGYEFEDSFTDYWKRVTFKIGGGLFVPQGKLETYVATSPLIELSLDFPVTEKKSLELALQFILPQQNSNFLFIQNDEIVEGEASLIFNPMLRFKKIMGSEDQSHFVLGLGLGASVINTTQKVSSSGDESFELTAFLAVPNLDYVFRFKNKEELTLSLGAHYAPYKIKGAIQENIGSFALTPRILYSF